MIVILQRTFAAWLLVPLLFSCASYNKSMDAYYANIQAHDYTKAMKNIEHNKLINKSRNALLYNLEMGKLYRLQNDYTNSNIYFNRADDISTSNQKTIGDIAVANLLNPMQQAYRGEDFEPFMMHYYKALNYAALGNTADAVVEARRITLASDKQQEKFKNENRYTQDAFALNLQGMIYEMAGNTNDAFISYRNAADIYLKNNNEYYGVKLPLQLQKDVIRTAAAMGFTNEQQRYQQLFNNPFLDSASINGEAIIFLEEGKAPVKKEKNFFLTTGSNGLGSFNYLDGNGYNSTFNFNYQQYGIAENKLTSLRAFRLALPQYNVQYAHPQSINISTNGNKYTPQLAQDINSVAVDILKQRFLTEMANTLARQLTKKLVEKGTQAAAESIAKNNDKKEDKDASKEEKEKQRNTRDEQAKQAGEIAGLAMNIFNTLSEKADTRNWQSLPAYISYVRIPLAAGQNEVTIKSNGKTISLKINGNKGLQMIGVNID